MVRTVDWRSWLSWVKAAKSCSADHVLGRGLHGVGVERVMGVGDKGAVEQRALVVVVEGVGVGLALRVAYGVEPGVRGLGVGEEDVFGQAAVDGADEGIEPALDGPAAAVAGGGRCRRSR